MKNLILITVLGISGQAFAKDIVCKSTDTNFKYLIETELGVLREYDHKGVLIGTTTGLKADYTFIETFPPKTVIQMKDRGGNVQIEVVKIGESMTGEIDDDYSLVCKYR